MNLPRLWRTVHHLSAEQWIYRAICLGRRVIMARMPAACRRAIRRKAEFLPRPDLTSPRLLKSAQTVLELQQEVHGDHLQGVPEGKFVLLNREVNFGSISAISWRSEFGDGNNPLWRTTLAYMGYAVPLLAAGQTDHLRLVERLLRGLEEQNPWSVPGVFRDVWSTYTVSHRLINLLSGLALYRQSGGTPDITAERVILEHVKFCALFVCKNLERDLQYNHLLKNYVALAVYASAIPAIPRPLRFLPKSITKSIAQNILPDGGHAERCPMYHALAMLDLDLLISSRVLVGDDLISLSHIREKMTAALGIMSHPDGDIALFNDSWLGEAPTAYHLGGTTAELKTQRLPDTGYVRLGGGEDVVIFDCGPCGPDDNPGHAHADFLSIEASIGGKRFLVDSGVPTYTAGSERDASRSARAHNGPRLEGAEPIEFWKSFRVGRRGRAQEIPPDALAGIAPLWCAGHHDGYANMGIKIRRFIGLWPGAGMLVCDAWIGVLGHPARTDLLIPHSWFRGDNGNVAFVQEDMRVNLSVLVGNNDGRSLDRVWSRFSLETSAHRVSLMPKNYGEYSALAFWLGWSTTMEPPDHVAVTSLLRRLVGW